MNHAKVELKPGGMFHYGMSSPDKNEVWGRFVFHEIHPISKLVYTVSFSDKHGGITRHPMAPSWPAEMLNVVELTEQDGKTTLTLTSWPINASDDDAQIFYDNFASMQAGFGGTYDQYESYLKEFQK